VAGGMSRRRRCHELTTGPSGATRLSFRDPPSTRCSSQQVNALLGCETAVDARSVRHVASPRLGSGAVLDERHLFAARPYE
jgi:hypothetical protein